ncbi:MAG: hypothetical protein E7615_08550 [Ruminococcaceae bacterium]|nr:hypothetical protein [Oscillospiraceae bacterium]
MNNYIDERLIPYNKRRVPSNKAVYGSKRSPLTRNVHKQNIVLRGLKTVAFVFLLIVSTFGGEKEAEHKNGGASVGSAVKTVLLYGGILLALWGVLVLLSKAVNVVTFLPMWCLIAIFALTILVTAGSLKK